MVSYHHEQYLKKLMIQSWENLVTDGRTDGQTDESDFVGRCLTNVKRPKEQSFEVTKLIITCLWNSGVISKKVQVYRLPVRN